MSGQATILESQIISSSWKEFDEMFNCNKCIVDRERELIDKLIDSKLLISTDNYDFQPGSIKTKREIAVDVTNYEGIEYKKYHPVSFLLFEDKFDLDKFTYQQLHLEVFDKLYLLERDRLTELAHNKLYVTNGKTPYMSYDKEEIRDPLALANELFIEKNIPPMYMFKFYFAVLDEMGLRKEDLKVILEEK